MPANALYLIIFILMAFLAFVMQHWGAPNIELYSYTLGCKDIPGVDASTCKGEQAVYRICTGTSIWFFLLAIVTRCTNFAHENLWFVKCAVLCVLVTGLFFVPIHGQNGYIQCARVISAAFLVSQIVSFIDLAYAWNDSLTNKSLFNIILGICATMSLAVMTATILLFVYYSYCQRQTLFISLTIIAIIGFTVLQLNTPDTENSLLTSCIVAAYCIYLCWSAVSADTCTQVSSDEYQLVLGALVTITSLAWTCYSTGKTKSNSLFHIMFAIGTVYMSMLLTNWGTIAGQHSEVRMWVTIASQWVAISLYTWTIIAPRCLPNRDFTSLEN